MRRVLVLLALVGLLYSPAAAVQAQQTCAESGMPMAGMTAAAAADGKADTSAADPCCDHGSKAPDSKACAQACAVMCGVVGALPVAIVYVPPAVRDHTLAAIELPPRAHPPPRDDRPPRFSA